MRTAITQIYSKGDVSKEFIDHLQRDWIDSKTAVKLTITTEIRGADGQRRTKQFIWENPFLSEKAQDAEGNGLADKLGWPADIKQYGGID